MTTGIAIPEWLRRKMGLTDDEQKTLPHSNSEPDAEVQALREEIARLETAIRNARADCIRNTEFCDGYRSKDRG